MFFGLLLLIQPDSSFPASARPRTLGYAGATTTLPDEPVAGTLVPQIGPTNQSVTVPPIHPYASRYPSVNRSSFLFSLAALICYTLNTPPMTSLGKLDFFVFTATFIPTCFVVFYRLLNCYTSPPPQENK